MEKILLDSKSFALSIILNDIFNQLIAKGICGK